MTYRPPVISIVRDYPYNQPNIVFKEVCLNQYLQVAGNKPTKPELVTGGAAQVSRWIFAVHD
jgi:hypothetical protein